MDFFKDQFPNNQIAQQLSSDLPNFVNRKILHRVFVETNTKLCNNQLFGYEAWFYLNFPFEIASLCMKFFRESFSLREKIQFAHKYRKREGVYFMFPKLYVYVYRDELKQDAAAKRHIIDCRNVQIAVLHKNQYPRPASQVRQITSMFSRYINRIPDLVDRTQTQDYWEFDIPPTVSELQIAVQKTFLMLNLYDIVYINKSLKTICGEPISIFNSPIKIDQEICKNFQYQYYRV
uniref:Uncharacterized protein n=1 Tax=Abalone asfa-like virus TaxID=2839893 RepID=A0A5K7XYN4_9VIRU|nr:hypothetical protein [Abalone asfa-like virus]